MAISEHVGLCTANVGLQGRSEAANYFVSQASDQQSIATVVSAFERRLRLPHSLLEGLRT
jgi:hypothetical protein